MGFRSYKPIQNNMKKLFAQKAILIGWAGIIVILLLLPKNKPVLIDSPLPNEVAKVEYVMTAEKLRYEVVEYLNEQEIRYTDNESIRCLMTKAMKIGYSPSDEMYTVENGAYIPSEDEIKQTQGTLLSGVVIK